MADALPDGGDALITRNKSAFSPKDDG